MRLPLHCFAEFIALTAGGAWIAHEMQVQPSREQPSSVSLRVCADPNNLPFSNEREEGFENKIAQVLASDLGAQLHYEWHAQRRGFLRNTLLAGRCDLVVGIVEGADRVDTTTPYYRSTYAFVSRLDRNLDIESFDAPLLRTLRVGVHVIGDDYANTPPVHALASRGIVNVHGYRLLGDYQDANPPARIIDAVAASEIDVAVVWGPVAGYFAKREAVPLRVKPLTSIGDTKLPFAYDISMGVRPGQPVFKTRIEKALGRSMPAIHNLLAEYSVPLLQPGRTP
jgi:mxaJ protein